VVVLEVALAHILVLAAVPLLILTVVVTAVLTVAAVLLVHLDLVEVVVKGWVVVQLVETQGVGDNVLWGWEERGLVAEKTKRGQAQQGEQSGQLV
jgi:hypothetical protein